MAQNFLIRWDDEFLEVWDGAGCPVWTAIPSRAAHFEYGDADETAQDLQETGFDVVVTDIFGDVATVEVIQRELVRPAEPPGVIRATDPEY